MSTPIVIATGSAVPIYKQISDQVRLGTASGRLQPGEQLPSVRALAEELVVNVNTVARAYSDLLREGIVESRQGRGVFIAERRKIYTRQETLRRLDAPLRALLSEAAALGITPDDLREIVDRELASLAPKSTPSSNRADSKHER